MKAPWTVIDGVKLPLLKIVIGSTPSGGVFRDESAAGGPQGFEGCTEGGPVDCSRQFGPELTLVGPVLGGIWGSAVGSDFS